MPEQEKHPMLKKDEKKPTVPPFTGEETKENPEEVETSEEETTVSEQETEEKPEVAEEKYDDEVVTQKELNKVYARMKAAEEKAKKAEARLAKNQAAPDVDAILEVQSATKGLDAEEVKELQLRSKAMGVPLSDARNNENFKIWREGRKAKVEREKALNPSTTQSEVKEEKPKSIDERLKNASLEEQEKILNELTFKNSITGYKEKGMNPLKSRNR